MLSNGFTKLSVDSPWSYLSAVLAPALDAVVPMVPSETVLITLGVTTSDSVDPRIFVLVALGAFGAFLGDNTAYLIGHRYGPAAERRFLRGEKGQRSKRWAQRALQERGFQIILICRFIPGGRTAVTVTCGLTGYPRSRFVPITAVAAVLWAGYSFGIGRFGGSTFKDNELAALGLAFGIAVVVSGLVELGRWIARRRHPTPADDRI